MTIDFNEAPPPIVICSTSGKCFPVLAASIEHYVPENVEIYWAAANPIPITDTRHKWHILPNTADNFGDAYNAAVGAALADGHSSVIMANDDIVLRPDSYQNLIKDVVCLLELEKSIGLVAARSDEAGFFVQNIRSRIPGDSFSGTRWTFEQCIVEGLPTVAPIFAWIEAEAFRQCPFGPITARSDDVQCYDLIQLGKQHFVSRSYVHHVGSQTVWDYNLYIPKDDAWVAEHRPHLWQKMLAPGDIRIGILVP